MGTFRVNIEIGDPEGTRYQAVNALVDTGASYTTVPGSILSGLGVPPHDQLTFILADGRRIRRDVGRTWILINGKSEITLVVSGEEGTDPLLGAYALQGLLLAGLYAFFESKAAWYDKLPPSFVNAIALVRRHLWLTSEGFSRSGVEPDTQKVQPLCTIHS